MSVTIFDWDDTLMATTYVGERHNSAKFRKVDREKMRGIEQKVYQLLWLALRHGEVCIITNAQMSWLIYSMEMYMPKIMPLLKKTKIYSARDLYEKQFPNEPLLWKYHTFYYYLKPKIKKLKNALAFGDLEVDRVSFLENVKHHPHFYHKNIKLLESPDLEHFEEQLGVAVRSFKKIHDYKGNYDLMMLKA